MTTRRDLIKASGIVGASALLTLNTPGLMGAAESLLSPMGRAPDFSGTRPFAVISSGNDSSSLGVRGGAGIAPGGPNAIAAQRDGRIAVLDTLNGRVAYVSGGRVGSTTNIPGAIDPLDLEAHETSVTVLDPAASSLFTVRGDQVLTQQLPREALLPLSRLSRNGDVPVLVEEDFQSYDGRYARATRSDGYPDSRGGRTTVSYGSSDIPRRSSAEVRQGDGVTFSIETTHALGSVIAMGRDDEGRAYFQVTEIIPSRGGLDVDLTLRRFSVDGFPAGAARVPVRGRHSHPRRAACFAPNGDAFALFPEPNQVRVLQLDWVSKLAPLAPLVSRISFPRFQANATLQIANCRATAEDFGNQYAHCTMSGGSWVATSTNLNHASRTDVAKPAYLVGPGTYYETPYCWGGMNLPVGFINEMNAGQLAGNALATGGYKAGTAGTDCSGMIQQCWGVGDGQKQDDAMLMNWIYEYGTQDVYAYLYTGDMWRLSGSHARMHHYYPTGGGGDYMYESTADWGNKAYHTFRPWSDYTNYIWCKGNFAC